MANRKAEKTTSKRISKKIEEIQNQSESNNTSFVNYLRLGESYTSLLLGIVVVIISSLLLVSFFKSRDSIKPAENKQQISASRIGPSITPRLTPVESEGAKAVVTPTVLPTTAPSLTPTAGTKPSATPTVAKATPTSIPTPTQTVQKPNGKLPTSYTTVEGDSLWNIAEKTYGSGYNWTDIAKANNLINPDILFTGTKLTLPQVEQSKIVSETQPSEVKTETTVKPTITGDRYTIVKGDDLWDVAVKVYGNGYRWTEIAKANNLTNPHVIHAGNVLNIPR